MKDDNEDRSAQNFSKKLIMILGEKHRQIKEAKFLMVAFGVVLVIMIIAIINIRNKTGL